MARQFKCEGCGEHAYYDPCFVGDELKPGRRCRLCGHEAQMKRRNSKKRDARIAQLNDLMRELLEK
jgi:hypothetical protein